MTDVAAAVAEVIGEDQVNRGAAEVSAVARDMGEPPALFDRLLERRAPELVVRPRDVEQLSRAVSVLSREGVSITPRGIGSCGLGGAVPVAGGALLDLSRMAGVVQVDPERPSVEVHAGTSFFSLEAALRPHGLTLQSRPTNAFGTVGGWASAGGLGLGSLQAGPIARQVDQLEVVHPDGTREMLDADDTRFADFFDTEGQMGLIGGLTLRVRREQRAPRIAGLIFPDLAAAATYVAQIADVKEGDPSLRTAVLMGRSEDFDGDLPSGEVLLVEGARTTDFPEVDKPGARNLDPEMTARLWRHRFFPMDSDMGPVFLASEALLPVERAAAFVERARATARRFGVPLHAHCHAVRGNAGLELLVLLMFPADPRQNWHHLMLTPLAAVLTSLAAKSGGRPYGVGIWNTPFARAHFGEERYQQIVARKAVVDPGGRLNPGKFFRVGTDALALSTVMTPGLYPTSLQLASWFAPLVMKRRDPSTEPATTADRCVSCGACVSVCPAVAATGNETVSARAKLGLQRRIAVGESPPTEELLGSQRCLKCGQCGEVCARGLPLVEAWDELEKHVGERVAPDDLQQVIATFVDLVDERTGPVLDAALP